MALKAELANRLIKDMLIKARGTEKATVMVMDAHASRIISSCCRMYDIMETGVVVVQNLSVAREHLDLPAIYFLTPNDDSIKRLIDDFQSVRRPKYPSAHLFFTTHVADAYMQLIAQSPLVKRIKTFVEINVDFVAFESRVFTLDRTMTIPRLYFPQNRDTIKEEILMSARQLVTVCLTLKQFPAIRYCGTGKNDVCKSFALTFEAEMKEAVRRLPEWKFNEGHDGGVLLIVDRAFDPVAPLMHEYTYQAMCTDLLKVHGELVYTPRPTPAMPQTVDEYKSNEQEYRAPPSEQQQLDEEAAPIVLSDDDSLWVQFRHKHIGEVMSLITQKFKEFRGNNKIANLDLDDKSVTVKQMSMAMRDLPEYKDMIQRYAKHMNLAEQCLTKYEQKRLKEIGDLEQSMATGLDANNKPVDDSRLKIQLVRLCQDPSIGVLERLRLIMIYIASRGGMQDATRRELLRSVDWGLQEAIRHLEDLGVDLTWASSGAKKAVDKARLSELMKRNQLIPYQLMRFVPNIQSVIQALIRDDLSETQFPWLSRPSRSAGSSASAGRSARRQRDRAHSDAASNSTAGEGSARTIIFMLGGMTQSEIRATYETAEAMNSNLIIGSSHVLAPREYIRELAGLNKAQFITALRGGSMSDPMNAGKDEMRMAPSHDLVDEDVDGDQMEALSIADPSAGVGARVGRNVRAA